MGKKVYNHNDYYGYINKIEEMAIGNPEWFWSNSKDATEARQWLHDNGAGAIIDEIYDYTPEDIKKTISYKKLTTNKAQEVYNQGIRNTTNEAAKYVGGALAASTALPTAISAFPTIAAEVAETVQFLATPVGKAAMSKLASDMAVSTVVGEAVNERARALGYKGFGDLASQSVGIDPETKGYNYISGAADFLNPGYIMGGAAANKAWNTSRLSAIEANNLTARAIERNKILREIADDTKQHLAESFGNLKSSIVKRINRIKDGVTSAEVPGTVLGPEVTPEYLPTERTLEQIYGIVTKPENVIRELSSINTKPSLPNEARRRIISEATLPESVPVETRPASTVTEFSEWTPKEPLSSEDRAILNRRGLGIYDIENLRQRGYTPEQLMQFSFSSTPELRTNARANYLDRELRELGTHPERLSRREFTRNAISVQPVYHAPNNVRELNLSRVHPGQSITMEEIDNAIRDGILPVDFDFSQLQLASPESINSYYSYFPQRVRGSAVHPSITEPRASRYRLPNQNSEPTILPNQSVTDSEIIRPSIIVNQWLPGSRSIFDDALQKEARDLNKSLSTLSEEEFRTMAPVIKDRIIALRDRVLSSGQTPSVEEARSMIKQELINLYRDKYNKLYKVELPNFTSSFDQTRTRAINSKPIFLHNNEALEAIFKDGDIGIGNWEISNPTIAATPYTTRTVPLEFVSGVDGSSWDDPIQMRNIVGSYSHFSAFGRDREALRRLRDTVFGDTVTHGRLAYEGNKSMDSTRMYNRHAYKAAKDGKGVILFDGLKDINRTDNKYNYVHTNDYAGTLYRPYIDALGPIQDLSTKKIADNIKDFSQVLKYTDPRIFRAFGGTPEIKAIIQRPGKSAQYIDLPYQAMKKADGTIDYVFDFLNTDAAGNHTSKAWKLIDDFDQEMLKKKNAGESLSGYKLGMLHPLTGFRSFKQGGILKRK